MASEGESENRRARPPLRDYLIRALERRRALRTKIVRRTHRPRRPVGIARINEELAALNESPKSRRTALAGPCGLFARARSATPTPDDLDGGENVRFPPEPPNAIKGFPQSVLGAPHRFVCAKATITSFDASSQGRLLRNCSPGIRVGDSHPAGPARPPIDFARQSASTGREMRIWPGVGNLKIRWTRLPNQGSPAISSRYETARDDGRRFAGFRDHWRRSLKSLSRQPTIFPARGSVFQTRCCALQESPNSDVRSPGHWGIWSQPQRSKRMVHLRQRNDPGQSESRPGGRLLCMIQATPVIRDLFPARPVTRT